MMVTELFIHGSISSRMTKYLTKEREGCIQGLRDWAGLLPDGVRLQCSSREQGDDHNLNYIHRKPLLLHLLHEWTLQQEIQWDISSWRPAAPPDSEPQHQNRKWRRAGIIIIAL